MIIISYYWLREYLICLNIPPEKGGISLEE